MKKRRYGREIALKVLYQQDTSGRPLDEILENTFASENITEDIKVFSKILAKGVLEHIADIDSLLSRLATHWKINRMAVIDRNILRIALYELSHQPETPAKVVINEAVEIAKKYGDAKSYQFINGILDSAAKDIQKKSSSPVTI